MTELAERIVEVLEPKIGRGLAQSVIRIKCKKMGITPDAITPEKLTVLADEFYEPLTVFAGEEFAAALTAQIRSIS